MNKNELRQILPSLHFFEGLSATDIDDICSILNIRHYKESEMIITEGDVTSKDLFILYQGTAVAKISTQQTDNANINVMKAGSIFGELALLNDAKRSASIVATSESTVFVLEKASFENLITTNQHLGLVIYRNIACVLADRIKNTNAMLKHTIMWGW
ncbi:MAG: cyclic nucleotide-binding domain-containing protein [Candidatus Margulisiibacteriota bacterium]